MVWAVTFAPLKGQVGTLLVSWTGEQPGDVWEFPLSIDLSQVKDLTPYADKVKAMKADHDAEKAKTPDYQKALDDLQSALNGSK